MQNRANNKLLSKRSFLSHILRLRARSKKKNMQERENKILRIVLIALALNILTFCLAFPAAFQLPKSAQYARDFSAYYIGGWRLLHNPTQIYYGGGLSSDPKILPSVQSFKYTPSFLLVILPFMSLSYLDALAIFDVLQFALIGALGFFVYQLVKDKSVLVASVAAAVVLVDPLPSLTMYYDPSNFLQIHIESLGLQTFSPGYFCGYMLGNAHVLQAILLVGAIYFGYAKKPWLSALLFSLGSFDPRGALLALPLLFWYNRHYVLKFIAGSAAFLAATNLPFFFYQGIGFAFLRAEVNRSITAQMYPYDWIPIYSIATLTIIEIITQVRARNIHINHPWNRATSMQKPSGL